MMTVEIWGDLAATSQLVDVSRFTHLSGGPAAHRRAEILHFYFTNGNDMVGPVYNVHIESTAPGY